MRSSKQDEAPQEGETNLYQAINRPPPGDQRIVADLQMDAVILEVSPDGSPNQDAQAAEPRQDRPRPLPAGAGCESRRRNDGSLFIPVLPAPPIEEGNQVQTAPIAAQDGMSSSTLHRTSSRINWFSR